MKVRPALALASLLLLPFLMGFHPPRPAVAQVKLHAGAAFHSVIPPKVCVGDTLTIQAGASVSPAEDTEIPWLPLTTARVNAALGQVNPSYFEQYNDGFTFSFTYKATTPGTETITIDVYNGLASAIERFEVEEKCDYDAFVTTVMHFSADAGGEQIETLSHLTGAGTMKRDREGSLFYQGDGTWHLESNTLTKPSICVEYYSPPLLMSGPFQLDGRKSDEDDTVDVIVTFQPDLGKTFTHGTTVCVDENGETGYGYSHSTGGKPSLASTIETAFPSGGGTQVVELEGLGMEIVRSAGDLDYTATLTLIPR